MSKISSYVCAYEIKSNGNLITGYLTSGVKLAGLFYWVFYGTSELIIVLKNRKRNQTPKDVGAIMGAD